MPYVQRTPFGQMFAIHESPQRPGQEFLPDDHPEIVAFKKLLEMESHAVPSVISHRQFYQAIALKGLITKDEALAAVQHGTIPERLASFVAEIKNPTEQFAAQMLLSGASEFQRNHPLSDAFGHEAGLTDPEIDELWRFAATL